MKTKMMSIALIVTVVLGFASPALAQNDVPVVYWQVVQLIYAVPDAGVQQQLLFALDGFLHPWQISQTTADPVTAAKYAAIASDALWQIAKITQVYTAQAANIPNPAMLALSFVPKVFWLSHVTQNGITYLYYWTWSESIGYQMLVVATCDSQSCWTYPVDS